MALIPWESREKKLRDIFDDLYDFGFISQSRNLRKRSLEGGEWLPSVDIIDKKDRSITSCWS